MAPIDPSHHIYAYSHEVLPQLRKRMGFTQSELAELLDVPVNTLSRWEIGKTTPDANVLAAIHSIAAERGVTPKFFTRREDPMQIQKQRTKSAVIWDHQNLDLKAEHVDDEWDWMERYLDLRYPKTRTGRQLVAYTSPFQRQAAQALQQSGFQVYQGRFDADAQIAADSRELCARNPQKMVYVLASGDGDFKPLIDELKDHRVQVHLWANDECSQKLKQAVGPDGFIPWELPYVVVRCVDVIRSLNGKPITLGQWGNMCLKVFDEDVYEIYPEDAGFSRKRPFRSALRHIESIGVATVRSLGNGSDRVTVTLN